MPGVHVRRRPGQALAVFSAAVGVVVALAGCSVPDAGALSAGNTSSTGRSSIPSSVPSATPGASATVAPPMASADPSLGAEPNRALFDATAQKVLAGNPSAHGREFIDALTAAGFDKAAMELTPDRTAADLVADSIQFSVRMKDGCLIGQTGPASGGYHSMVAGVLSTGKCLLGATRQIDW